MRYLLLLCLLWAGTQVQSQKLEPTSLAIPDSLRGGNSVVLEYTVDYRILDRSSAIVSYRKVVTLLNDEHEEGNVLREFYDGDSKITSLAAASYDFLGNQIGRAKSGDIIDSRAYSKVSFYEDNRYQEVTVPCTGYPCTVVFEVEKRVSEFNFVASFRDWSPVTREQALVQASLTVTMPADNELLYRANALADPTVSVDAKERSYHWTVDHLPAQATEPYAPSPATTLPYVRLALADFEIEGYRGSFRDWQSFGTFMQAIMQDRDVLPPRLAQEVREVVAGATDERDKIDRLYRFMQQRMRYVGIQLGIGGWQPFSAEYVEQNRYGDCKALSNYMGAMLKSVGIESYPVLINWNEREYYPVAEDFTTSAFNHMVIYIPSQEMYLECTSHDAPTGYLGEDKQDRNVLWITPEGGKLARTPKLAPAENGYTRTVDLSLADNGTTAVAIHSTFYGGAHEIFRGLVDYMPSQKEQLKALHRNDFLPDVSGSGYSLSVDPGAPRATLAYATEVNNYVRKLGTRMFVPLNGYYAYDWIPEADERRELPIHTVTTRYVVDTINLHLPRELEIESGLFTEEVRYTHAAGEYRAHLQPTEDGVQWVRSLKILPVDLPKEAYTDYRQFFLDVAKADRSQLVVRQRKTK